MSIDVDNVCTHADLIDEAGGQEQMDLILAQSKDGGSRADRERGLQSVMKILARQTPPIFEEDLADATELRDAVAYATLERMYAANVTTVDSVFEVKRKRFADMFDDEIGSMRPTLSDRDVRGPALSFRTERG